MTRIWRRGFTTIFCEAPPAMFFLGALCFMGALCFNRVMDVPGVGAGPAGADRAMAAGGNMPPAPAAPAGLSAPVGADSVAALLRELSETGLARLAGILENAPSPGREAQVRELLQAAVSALAEQSPHTLGLLRQLAVLDPARAEALASEPGLAAIRPAVEQLVRQLAREAQANAEGRLAEAGRLVETSAVRNLAGEMSPEILVQVAAQLIEAGGLANYVRSAAVSGVILDNSRWAPAPHGELVAALHSTGESKLPMRFLLLTWLALGMAGAGVCWYLQYDRWQEVFEVWGGGLLVLACFGAWRRVRPS